MSSRSRLRFGKLCFESRNLRLERLDFAFHRRAAATASVAGQAGKLALQGLNLLLDLLGRIGRTVATATASAPGLGRTTEVSPLSSADCDVAAVDEPLSYMWIFSEKSFLASSDISTVSPESDESLRVRMVFDPRPTL